MDYETQEQTQGPEVDSSAVQEVPTLVARKQNVACDACRAKKVKCNRVNTTDRCAQCEVKGAECTSRYIEQLAAKAKRGTQPRKRRKPNSSEHIHDESTTSQVLHDIMMPNPLQAYLTGDSAVRDEDDGRGESSHSGAMRLNGLGRSHEMSVSYTRKASPATLSATVPLFPSQKQYNLLRYLFSPYPVTHSDYRYNDVSSIELCEQGYASLYEEEEGQIWTEAPSRAHAGIDDDLHGLAESLVETFFSVVYPRFLLYEPAAIRSRFANPDTHPMGPLPHNLIAVVIAFGSRFSTHETLSSDRQECGERHQILGERVRPRSRMIQLLIIRAREVLEVTKSNRIATLENAQTLLYAENMLGEAAKMGEKYRPYLTNAAIRHVLALGCDTQQTGITVLEHEKKSAFDTWWMACIADGFGSAFHRLTPVISDDVGEHDPPKPPPINPGEVYEMENPDLVTQAWYAAVAAGSKVARTLSAGIWTRSAASNGIPLSVLQSFITNITAWRDAHLGETGVPREWPTSWGFTEAIQTCTTDVYYHTLWLVVHRAIEEYGVFEEKQVEKVLEGFTIAEVDGVKREIAEQAEHAALRIGALVSILLLKRYLQIDALILHKPIYEAGMYLARKGRPEYQINVEGIKQYSEAYPQFWDQADEMDRTFAECQSGGLEIRVSGLSDGSSMAIGV